MSPILPSLGTSHLRGLDELLTKLRTLVPKLQKRGLRGAMGKGAGVVKKAAIANAKAIDRGSTPRMIWKNIAVQMSGPQGKRVKGIVMRVGVLGGARQRVNNIVNRRAGRVGQTYSVLGDSDNPGGDTWYWRFIEFGSSKMRARPFMLPALRANADRATDVIRAELERQIGKLASKAGP